MRPFLILIFGFLLGYATCFMVGQANAEIASWYQDGHRTATGERFDPDGLTCASRTIPAHTVILIGWNGQMTWCRVNDFGPAAWTGRDLDLSEGAAKRLGMIETGVAKVEIIDVERLP